MINRIILHISLLMAVLSASGPIMAQGEWKLKEEKDGIRIYTRDNPYSDFDEFRAETESGHTIRAFLAVLKDVEAIPEWMYSVKRSRLLERQGDSVQVYYTEAKTPFPFSNRDGIYLNRFRWDEAKKKLTVVIELLPGYLDTEDGMVRISKGKGYWEVHETDAGRLHITFQMQVDPGGSIPAWLANMFVVDTPYHTLKNLMELMSQEKYRDENEK